MICLSFWRKKCSNFLGSWSFFDMSKKLVFLTYILNGWFIDISSTRGPLDSFASRTILVTLLLAAKWHSWHRELWEFGSNLDSKRFFFFLKRVAYYLRAPTKKNSTYKPSPRLKLSGDTKGSASEYAIWEYFGYNQRVSSSVFKVKRIIE